ncbi:MAG: flavin reductase family protein [Paracoccaceae bacterium]|nr:MAG: flavin reductase family protein [Paracoccaceae bacterium]
MTDLTFTPDAANARAFRDALGRFSTGVCVITAQGPDGHMGFTANSFASLSMDPPLVLWSPAKASLRYPVLVAAPHYAIHVLGADQGDVSRRFVRGGAGFDGLPHGVNAEGVPVIEGCLARFDCRQHALHDGGDHTIVVGLVLRAALAEGTPLVFSAGRYGTFAQA